MAASSRVAAAMAAGGSPFDALPDELVTRIIAKASGAAYLKPGAAPICEPSGAPRTRYTDHVQHFNELVQLSHVSRRFRSLAGGPSLWERLLIKTASESVLEALFALPEKRREALRSLWMRSAKFSSESFIKLCRQFSMQLTNLNVSFCDNISLGVLTAIQHFSRLEQLSVICKGTNIDMHVMTGPLVQGALQALASLPLVALELKCVRITPETLQVLASLAPTLKRLHCDVILDGGNRELRPVISSIAAFRQLEHLYLGFYSVDGDGFHPVATEEDLQPLSSLSSLRAFVGGMNCNHLGFLSGMPQLEYAGLLMDGLIDISPLLPLAGGLQNLCLIQANRVHDMNIDVGGAALTSFAVLTDGPLLPCPIRPL